MDEQYEDERPTEPRTGPVRIIGAHRAGGSAEAEEEPGAEAGFGPEDWESSEPALPHWTEAPTGEVPAVLSRPGSGDGENPWTGVPEPSWREEHADWDRADPLDAALWPGAGEGRSLDETDAAEREPWSFELAGPGQAVEEQDDEEEDLFVSWEEGAASESRWTREPQGNGAALVGQPEGGERWAPEEETWDPDAVAGEKTSVMRLPEPPEVTEEELPPPPHADVDVARHARTPGPEEHADLSDDALEEEALAADLEARWGHRRRTGRSDRVAPSVPPPPPSGRAPRGTAVAGLAGGHARGEDAVSQRTGRNMPAAIASGVAIGVLALIAFHFGTVPSMVVVTAVIGLAAVEAFAAFRRAGYHPATLLGLVAVVGLVIGTYIKTEQALPLVTVLLVAGTFVWHLAGVDRRAEPVRSSAATLLVFGWVGVFGSFAALLLAPSLFPDRHGIAYLLGALIAAVAYDVGALAAGAWLGRHPLSAVSPGKTWEGVIGGAVAAIVLSVGVVHLIHPWTLGHAAALGVIVAVVSPIGDLCESMVKRRIGLKDMGRILPGHGGVLDRIDGLLFVLPATFYLVRAFHG